jgi:hypothetical protein
MKFIASFLVICFIFLFSTTGIADTSMAMQKGNCCKSQICGHPDKGTQKKSCEEGLCNRMFSCSRLVLFINPALEPDELPEITQTASLFNVNIGVISDYAKDDWHPPKV